RDLLPYSFRTKARSIGCRGKGQIPAREEEIAPRQPCERFWSALPWRAARLYFSAMDSSLQPVPGVAWFDIADPKSPELDKLAHQLGFHELQVEDCRHRPQRAKTEEHEHYIFCVLKHLRNDADFTFEDFDVFLTRSELVSVHEPESDIREKTRVRAEQS